MHSEEEELWIFLRALLSTESGDNDLLSLPHRAQSLHEASSSAYPEIDHDYRHGSFLRKSFYHSV